MKKVSLLAIFLLVAGTVSSQDEIILKDGKKVEGLVVGYKDGKLQIKVADGKVVNGKIENVKEIIFDSTNNKVEEQQDDKGLKTKILSSFLKDCLGVRDKIIAVADHGEKAALNSQLRYITLSYAPEYTRSTANNPRIHLYRVPAVGVVGVVAEFKVIQVIDEESALISVADRLIWVEALDTSKFVDNQTYHVKFFTKIDGTKSYATVAGGKKTVLHCQATPIEELDKARDSFLKKASGFRRRRR